MLVRLSLSPTRIVSALVLFLARGRPLLAQHADPATGVETVLVTNAAGAYTTAPPGLGAYTVTVNLSGARHP